MIYCKRGQLSSYAGLSAMMERAVSAIGACDLQNLQPGKNELCEGISGNRFGYETLSEDSMLYETHVKYIDVHLLLSGEEYAAVADVETLTEVERRPESDYIGSQGSKQALVHLTPETVLVVFPGEAHKPRCAVAQPARVEKFVVKVPVD